MPLLEQASGLIFNTDFFCGYSPERIVPGDKVNTLTTIKKVTSGSTPEIANFVDDLYSSIITAGTFKAASMKVAEASKAIENAQRDVNISFVNELALIFDRVGIDTQDVLDAAGTKWNFLKYKPGLVGGHCISVDPYYLAYKAENLGYHPEVILSGRRVNDNMSTFVANKMIKMLIKAGKQIMGSKILILGITFKAASMKVAEASKAIENAQRDVNISFVNELALIFDRVGIDTQDVLDAAGTKWNFLKYKPGLVGGHCISVDPYYLAYKAENLGYHPEVILSGRRVNDNMSTFVANKMIKMLIRAGKQIMGSKILMLGVTFKENCPDIRNSKVADVYNELKEFGLEVDAYDYEANSSEVKEEYGIDLIDQITEKYDGILLAVSHDKFSWIDIESLKKDSNSIVFDLKGFLPRNQVNSRL